MGFVRAQTYLLGSHSIPSEREKKCPNTKSSFCFGRIFACSSKNSGQEGRQRGSCCFRQLPFNGIKWHETLQASIRDVQLSPKAVDEIVRFSYSPSTLRE